MDSKNFIEITPDVIAEVDRTLKSGFCDYKLKEGEFSEKNFKNGEDIVLIQMIGDEEYELPFQTAFEDDIFYISTTFDVICNDLIYGRESRDIFQSVNEYFHDVIENPENDFKEEKDSLINFLVLSEEGYVKEDLEISLNPENIRKDYESDKNRIYAEDDLTDIQKSLALKELLHMSICQVVGDIDLFYTRPFDLSPAEHHEKDRQEAEALKNELKWS